MLRKYFLKLELKKVTKAKRKEIKNLNFSAAATLRDREKVLLNEVGKCSPGTINVIHRLISDLVNRITNKYKLHRMKGKLAILSRKEVQSIEKLNYKLANQIRDEKRNLWLQIEKLEKH